MTSPLAADLLAAADAAQLAVRLGLNPDPWQLEVLRSTHRRTVMCCGRQVGKSEVLALAAVHQGTYTADSLVLMVAPSQRQSSELFRRCLARYRALGRPVPAEQENMLSLTLENGSRIVCVPGSEATIRGFAAVDLLILDEASRISDELVSSVTPMVAVSQGRIIAASTPWGRRGWFFEATGDPAWHTVTVRADQCPRWSVDDLAEFRRQRGDWIYRQEMLAEFVDGAGMMFRSDDIDAMGEDFAEPFPSLFDPTAPDLRLIEGGAA